MFTKLRADHRILTTEPEIESFGQQLLTYDIVACDTETTGLDTFRHWICGFVFGTPDGLGWYIPIRHLDNPKLAIPFVISCFQPFFRSAIPKVFHNAKFDLQMLEKDGILVNGPIHDTMLMARIVDSSIPSAGLKYLAKNLLGKETIGEDWLDKYKTKHKISSYAQIPYELLGSPYACEDGQFTLALYKHLAPQVVDSLVDLNLIEHKVLPYVSNIEKRGCLVDIEYFKQAQAELQQKISEVKNEVKSLTHSTFNPFSGREVISFLKQSGVEFTELTERGKGFLEQGYTLDEIEELGAIKSDKKTLQKIDHELIEKVLSLRLLNKVKTTYVDNILTKQIKGILHTTFRQIGADTGRFSSSDPNLQNIIKSIADIRKGFICRPGYRNFYADFRQQEYALVAHYTNDKKMIRGFVNGKDFHEETARTLGLDPKKDRGLAKNVSFLTLYGGGAPKLALTAGMSIEEATEILELYFKKYPSVKRLMYATKEAAYTRGYIKTLMGRRRVLTKRDDAGFVTFDDSRKALNSLIQGCISYDTLITTPDGLKKIGDLSLSKIPFEVCTEKRTFAAHAFSSGTKDVYRYHFVNGGYIEATPDHRVRILTEHMNLEWKSIGEISITDYIVSPIIPTKEPPYKNFSVVRNGNGRQGLTKDHCYNKQVYITEDLGWILGILVGDGCCYISNGKDPNICRIQAVFSNKEYDNALLFAQLIAKITDNKVRVFPGIVSKGPDRNHMYTVATRNKCLSDIFRQCGVNFTTCVAHTKEVPGAIFDSPQSVICSFLNGLFTADGTAAPSGYIVLTTVSPKLAHEVSLLLMLVGIRSRVNEYENSVCKVTVTSDAPKFLNIIGFTGEYKSKQINTRVHSRRNTVLADIPIWLSKIIVSGTYSANKNSSLRTIKSRVLRKEKPLSRETALRFKSKSAEQQFLVGNTLKRVESYEYIGKKEVYDIAIVDGPPEFIANGILIHNSAADIMKVSVYKVGKFLGLHKYTYPSFTSFYGCHIILTIHDELVIEVPIGQEAVVPRIKEIMEFWPQLKVPMVVDISVTDSNWLQKISVTKKELDEMAKLPLDKLPKMEYNSINPYAQYEESYDRRPGYLF